MNQKNMLLEAFKNSKYQLPGHGPRDIKILQEAFQNRDGAEESDLYGSGKIIEDFQEKMANLLGNESGLFLPSGTMAQQIALRIWCDQTGVKKVAYHPLCHIEIHEENALMELHGIQSILLADESRVIELEDVMNMDEDVSCLLLELPQREIGGQLPSYDTLESISNYCCQKGIKLHLDGARLLEVLPFYQKSASEICSLFDSVYMSVYKGIGGIAGAVLVGNEAFIQEAKIWKRRYGGDLISLYPYIISADYYFEKRKNKMQEYYKGALKLAKDFNECHGVVTRPVEPVSNMFHVHFSLEQEEVEMILADIYGKTNVGFISKIRGATEDGCYFELSVGDNYEMIPEERLKRAFELLDKKIKDKG